MADRFRSPVIVTGDPDTHHFVALTVGPGGTEVPVETDADGRVAVYTDRDRCEDAAFAKLGGAVAVLFVMGMAEANWKAFSSEVAHYLAD